MKLHRNKHDGGWTGQAQFRNAVISIAIDAELYDRDPQETAECALANLGARWPEVEASILHLPYEIYKECWAEEQTKAISPRDFLRFLAIRDISIGNDSVFVSFSDGGLFSGHFITVAIIGDDAPAADIEG